MSDSHRSSAALPRSAAGGRRPWLEWLAAVTTAVMSGCADDGRAPLNLRLEADTDSTVKVTWSVPIDATPDEYLIYFQAVGETSFSLVGETTANLWVHNPNGATGWYRVEAKFGAEQHPASTNPTTVPVWTDTVTLAELNGEGDAGFGWSQQSGRGRTVSLTDLSSVSLADFYITDFEPAGVNQQPYSFASPDMGPSDAGNAVPTDSWRVSAFTDPLPGENAVLPSFSETAYFNYADILHVPCSIGCFTADGYYALVKVAGVDVEHRRVRVETWYQLVPGLRLTRH